MKADFAYSTAAVPGNLITFDDSISYLLVALAKSRFENLCISKEGVMYLCNIYANVTRYEETDERDENYDPVVDWVNIHSGELGLFTGQIEPDEYKEEKYGVFTLQKDTLYISDELDVKPGDRIWLKQTMDVSGESRMVKNIESKMFPGIKICLLGQDTRE